MIQLIFDADDVNDALATAPTEVRFAQHEGAERADWDDAKLVKQGTHPLVYPGAGSHASYFEEALFLAGEIYRAAGRIYRRRPGLFFGLGLVFLPLGGLTTALQELVLRYTPLGDLVDLAFGDKAVGLFVVVFVGGIGTAVAETLVFAATAESLMRLEAGYPGNALESYRGVLPRLRSLLGILLEIFVVVALLSVTIVGIPFAIVYVVRRAVTVQACIIERLGSSGALARSRHLTGYDILKLIGVGVVVNLMAVGIGPLLGTVVLLLWSPGLRLVNVISALVYAAVVPYAAIAIALLFYDLRHRSVDAATASEPQANP